MEVKFEEQPITTMHIAVILLTILEATTMSVLRNNDCMTK